MTSNSTSAVSFYDNYAVCNPPAQVYIGGLGAPAVRTTGTAVLSVARHATNLVNAARRHDSVHVDQLDEHRATATPPRMPFRRGTFTGGTQTLRNIAAGTWVENCLTFAYANTTVPRQGTYTGRVTYHAARCRDHADVEVPPVSHSCCVR